MRRFQCALMMVLVLLMPFRAFAAASLEPASSMAPSAVHAHDCCDQDEGSSSGPCAEHDCCATFIATAAAVPLPALAGGTAPIRIGARFGAGFVPEHLDPPPLVL